MPTRVAVMGVYKSCHEGPDYELPRWHDYRVATRGVTRRVATRGVTRRVATRGETSL